MTKKSVKQDFSTADLFQELKDEFEQKGEAYQQQKRAQDGTPLAERMRPHSLDEFVGQQKVLGKGTLLRRLIEKDELRSFIFWGPPGTGKTTLAQIIASKTESQFLPFSAVTAGIKEVKAVMLDAERYKKATSRRTVLFVDEIHRFNRAQQDAFLPYVESGTIILIGATTENPSFEINSALLSRSHVVTLETLEEDELVELLERALKDRERGLGSINVDIEPSALGFLARFSAGDARNALNCLEMLVLATEPNETGVRVISESSVGEILHRTTLRYDKSGEEHFNIISAFIKSIRNSDPDAALYWLARMLEAGEDPIYVARRLVHHASEDVGLADPLALQQAIAAKQAVELLGLPECKLALAQATLYLSLAPKSNSVYVAYKAAASDALKSGREVVPLHLRNAPTSLMKRLGYGEGYQYAHDFEEARTEMQCLPENLAGRRYYNPSKYGWEGNRFKTESTLHTTPDRKDN